MNRAEQLRTIRCCYCGSISLMIPDRFEMGQFCLACRISSHKQATTVEEMRIHITDFCNTALAWKNEAKKLGYKGAIRLEYEDENKPVSPKHLMDQWTRLRQENDVLKKQIVMLKGGE